MLNFIFYRHGFSYYPQVGPNVIDSPRHVGMCVHLFLVEFARSLNVRIRNLNDQHEVAPVVEFSLSE
jgi:hypothetical protein